MQRDLQQTLETIERVEEQLEGIIVEAKLKIVELENKIRLKADQGKKDQKVLEENF